MNIMKLEFYNKFNIENINIKFPDVYFTPTYGIACEYSENAEWECCVFKDLIYVYIKRPIEYNNKVFYDLITPYGYSGYNFNSKDSYDEFLPLFREKAVERNYITEVVRQNPYIDIKLTNYEEINSKTIFGIKIDNFQEYWNNVLNTKKRNMFTKALKQNLKFELRKLTYNELKENFMDLYNSTMNKVNAKSYYYFNENYYKSIENIENSYLAEVFDSNNVVIGCSIIFTHENFIHYHLSCNNNSMNCITDFLLINIVKEIGNNKLIILGGGLKDDDALSKFKKSLSNEIFTYTIYKNILDENMYNLISKTKESNLGFPCYR